MTDNSNDNTFRNEKAHRFVGGITESGRTTPEANPEKKDTESDSTTTDERDTFTTDSSPGDPAFESTVSEAVSFIENALDADDNWYGPRLGSVLQACVRTALRAEGEASPERVAHAARDLGEHDDPVPADTIEPLIRRLEAMIDNSSRSGPNTSGANP